MLATCKNCGKKLQLPDEVRKDARYICPSCKSVLSQTEITGDTATPNVAPRQIHNEGAVSGGILCPFSWIQVTEAPGCLAGLFGGKAKQVWKAQPCMGSRCKLWDSTQGDCGLITKK